VLAHKTLEMRQFIPSSVLAYFLIEEHLVIKAICGSLSADEFSTITSHRLASQGLYALLFDETRSRSAQSVRPFVQSSSCVMQWRRKQVGVEVYLDVIELVSSSLIF
jgi:hypothetical protein